MGYKEKPTNTKVKAVTIRGYYAEALAELEDPRGYVESVLDEGLLINLDARCAGHDTLQRAGFTPGAILAVCDVMNGVLLHPYFPLSQQIAASMQDGELLDGVAKKWGVPIDLWGKLTDTVRGGGKEGTNEMVVHYLHMIVQEFWRDNTPLVKKLLADWEATNEQAESPM